MCSPELRFPCNAHVGGICGAALVLGTTRVWIVGIQLRRTHRKVSFAFLNGQKCSWIDLQFQESLSGRKLMKTPIFAVIGEIHKILPLVPDVKQIN